MKHYELKYDNLGQKILWTLEMVSPCLTCPFICILLWFIIFSLFDISATAISIIIVILSFAVGIALSIYNLRKHKGVFVFYDYFEIVSHHIINKRINFEDIYKLEKCEKYDYFYYVKNCFWSPSAGGRRNCILIETPKTVVCIKVRNQQELAKILEERSNINFS